MAEKTYLMSESDISGIRDEAIDECIRITEECCWRDADMLVDLFKNLKDHMNGETHEREIAFRDEMVNNITELGYCHTGDIIRFDGELYRVGHTDGRGLGLVICTSITNNKIKKIHIDCNVEIMNKKVGKFMAMKGEQNA